MKETQPAVRKTTILIFASTFLLGFSAHAFRYFSMGFSHDSVFNLYQNDAQWQISLGRFLQPVYLLLRGQLCAPFLMGLFSLTWLAIAICLVVTLLEIKSPAAIVLICGILSTNSVLSLSNATYLYSSDIYMFALLAGVLSVYLQRRYKFGFLFGAVSVAASLALYQSYFEVAVFLSLILLVKDCLEGYSAKDVFIRALKALCMLILGLILYYLCLKIVLSVVGVDLATSYNGISSVGDYSGTSVLKLLTMAYAYAVKYVFVPRTFHPVLASVINLLIIVVACVELIKTVVRKKLPKSSIWLLAALLMLMPLGWNVVYIISQGFKHDLMYYSFFFVYVFVLMILGYRNDSFRLPPRGQIWNWLRRNLSHAIVLLGIALLIVGNIIYANHLYLKKELEYQATLSTITRVIDRMEQTDGYVVSETPVVIVGSLIDSELSVDHPGFEYINAEGVKENFSVTYLATYSAFFDSILGYPVNLITDKDEIYKYSELPVVGSMPTFPALGSCAIIDNVLIVKLSK